VIAACADPTDHPPVLVDGAFSESAQVGRRARRRYRHPVDPGPRRATRAFPSLDLGKEADAQSLPGTLHLLVDADGGPSTGEVRHGMHGVDLGLDLSRSADVRIHLPPIALGDLNENSSGSSMVLDSLTPSG
jgi:hypothetical protein